MHRQGGDLWFNQATNALAALWQSDCQLTPEHFKALVWGLLNMNQAMQMSLADIHAHIAQLGEQPQNPDKPPPPPPPRAPWIIPNR